MKKKWMKTQVAIIGSGPAGLMLSEILHLNGIESVVLEAKSREHVISRIRAGVLEQATVELLKAHGLGDRMAQESRQHNGFKIVWGEGNSLFIDIAKHIGKTLTIYGQMQIQIDLFSAADKRGAIVLTEVENVQPRNIDSSQPYITFHHQGDEITLNCDFIAGCDGSHGVSRKAIPSHVLHIYEKVYPFGWLGVLSPTPPLPDIIYANHARGFALASARNSQLSRYYIQVPLDNKVNDWSDERFWNELKARYPAAVSHAITPGPALEKSIVALRSYITEPMHFGRLFLAGDAAHLMPPTGAKGLNLAMSDVFYLSRALHAFYNHGSTSQLDMYSQTALRRVWSAVRVSWYLTNLLHRFPDASEFDRRTQEYELRYLASSHYAQTALAEQYAGIELET